MKIVFNTGCPEINEAIQKLAFKAGYSWNGRTTIFNLEADCLCIDDYGNIGWEKNDNKTQAINKSCFSHYKKLNLEEIIEFLKTPRVPPIKIDEYEVVLSSDKQSIKVGCKTISRETVLKIAKLFE